MSVIAPVGGNTFVPRDDTSFSESGVSWVSSISDDPSSFGPIGDSMNTSIPTTARDAGFT